MEAVVGTGDVNEVATLGVVDDGGQQPQTVVGFRSVEFREFIPSG